MLFWIFLSILLGGIAFLLYYNTSFDGWCWTVGSALSTIGVVSVIISLVIMACTYMNIQGQIDELHVKHEVLTYQLENGVYDSDNNIGMKELFTDILEYNKEVAWNKKAQDNFWIGIYVPDIYDQIDFIELGG